MSRRSRDSPSRSSHRGCMSPQRGCSNPVASRCTSQRGSCAAAGQTDPHRCLPNPAKRTRNWWPSLATSTTCRSRSRRNQRGQCQAPQHRSRSVEGRGRASGDSNLVKDGSCAPCVHESDLFEPTGLVQQLAKRTHAAASPTRSRRPAICGLPNLHPSPLIALPVGIVRSTKNSKITLNTK